MNLCSSHDGDEVCFEGNKCPACEIQEDREKLRSDLEDTKSALEEAKENLDKANAELEERANNSKPQMEGWRL